MEHIQPWMLDISGGTLLGIALGYALKRSLRIGLFILGLCVLLLMVLEYYQLISVQWDTVSQTVEGHSQAFGSWLWSLTLDLSAKVVGMAAGIVIGFRLR